MQTRAAARSAAAAAVSRPAAVTPSPKRRKACSLQNLSGSRSILEEDHDAGTADATREEMKKMVLSRLMAADTSALPSSRSSSTQIATTTLDGWCLVDGLTHCASAADGKLLPLIEEHGPPSFYLDHLKKIRGNGRSDASRRDCYKSFRSLCRIVAGQQLAGPAAKTIWRRLLEVVGSTEDDTSNLTPQRILSIAKGGESAVESNLRSPAGLSKTKARCIVDLARHYSEGHLSDELILEGKDCNGDPVDDDGIRSRLLSVKGIGPWSVNMLLLFQLHRPDILPITDLAVCNGTGNLFNVKGSAKGGKVCMKKDADVIKDLHEPFAPYRSISAYYMYKCSGMKT